MKRKHDVEKINLTVRSMRPFCNDKFDGISIEWESDIGFGEYTIYRPVGEEQWCADSEHMDTDEDKAFLHKLLGLIADGVSVRS